LQKARAFVPPVFFALLLLTLGILTWRQCHMYVDAETLWRTTISRNPDSYLAHNNLGTLLLRQGRSDEAMTQFQKVVVLAPDYEVGHYDLGHALFRQGRSDEAIAEFRRAVDLDPSYAKAHNNLANLLLRQGKAREALTHYEAALKLRPKSPDFANNVAWLLATSPDAGIRDGPRAIALALQAESVSQAQEPVFIATLAAAYAEAGQFSEAVATAQRALQLAQAHYNGALAAALNDQMALYQAGKTFRTTTEANLPGAQDSRQAPITIP
jgi:tetratricopeptide (TPR) repeat protein